MEAEGLYADTRMADGLPSPIRSQHANVMAVLGGICPAGQRQDVLRRIIDPSRLGSVPVGEHSLKPEMRAGLTGMVPAGMPGQPTGVPPVIGGTDRPVRPSPPDGARRTGLTLP